MKSLYTKKLVILLVDKDMATVNKFRAEQIRRLVQIVKKEATVKDRKITTVDPIMRIGKMMFPTLTRGELLEFSQTALRIIFTESSAPSYQTTLFAHI
jgi:pantothenate kinase-related protein Tda10